MAAYKYDLSNLILFPFPGSWLTWQERGGFNRPAHIIRELQKRSLVRKILIVDPPRIALKAVVSSLLRKEGSLSVAGGTLFRTYGGALQKVNDKIYVLESWRLLPFRNSSLLWHLDRWMTRPLLVSLVRRAIEVLKMSPRILWLGSPLDATFMGAFGEDGIVVDAVDNLLEHPRLLFLKTEVEAGYERIAQEADLVFTVSESLADFFRNLGHKMVWHIPNGVDVEHFQNPTRPPEELQNLLSPIIGYVGTMIERIDLDILSYLAEEHPDWNFVLVGPLPIPPELGGKNNVHFTGMKHYDQLPSYIRAFDVCVVPHVVDEFACSMNPIKVYEYLACGKPVVSTPVPPSTCTELTEVVHIAADKIEFDQAVQLALQEDEPALAQRRLQIAAQQSWEIRVDDMLKHIAGSPRYS